MTSEDVVEVQTGQSGQKDNHTANDNEHANDLIQQFDTIGVKLQANLVHQPG